MAERLTPSVPGALRNAGIAAGQKIEVGNIVGVNSAGYATAVVADMVKAIGVARETIENTGAAGEENINAHADVIQVENSGASPVSAADLYCTIDDGVTVKAVTDAATELLIPVYAVTADGVQIDLRGAAGVGLIG